MAATTAKETAEEQGLEDWAPGCEGKQADGKPCPSRAAWYARCPTCGHTHAQVCHSCRSWLELQIREAYAHRVVLAAHCMECHGNFAMSRYVWWPIDV